MTTKGKVGLELWKVYDDANKRFQRGLDLAKAGEQIDLSPLIQDLKSSADNFQRHYNQLTRKH